MFKAAFEETSKGVHTLSPVQRLIRANPRLNCNLRFLISPLFKKALWAVFSLLYRASNHRIPYKKNSTKYSFKAFRSEIRFLTNPGLAKPNFEWTGHVVSYELTHSFPVHFLGRRWHFFNPLHILSWVFRKLGFNQTATRSIIFALVMTEDTVKNRCQHLAHTAFGLVERFIPLYPPS